VVESPIPVVADIHFNYTLALKASTRARTAYASTPATSAGPTRSPRSAERAKEAGTPLRIGVNSGSLPKHLRELEFSNPVEALVTAASEFVALMERLEFTDFKVSMKSTSVPKHDRVEPPAVGEDRLPAAPRHHRGGHEVVGLAEILRLPGHAARGRHRRHDSHLALTFHAEEEVKVAWEILKALKLRERGPVLIACPTCGRLQFDMDSVVPRSSAGSRPTRTRSRCPSSVCAVNGIGEARHADFGITGAKNEGMVYSKGEPLRKVPTDELVDVLFEEIDKYYAAGKKVVKTSARRPRAPSGWPRSRPTTPASSRPSASPRWRPRRPDDEDADRELVQRLDEGESPVAGRRFSRA